MENEIDLLMLIEQAVRDDAIDASQIPGIDLYMDQVTTFLENALGGNKRNDTEKVMTKTMVNNYTKDKVLPPPVHKKYSKDHMLMLIIIYHLKQSLSIGDVKKLLPENMNAAAEFYGAFECLQRDAKKTAADSIDASRQKLMPPEDKNGKEKILLLIISLILEANTKKQLAAKLIDNFFG
ncbi:MAG: DUF1836 domain-containing protein [Defluviitaleaceae bacterium]|nr:DUF1836 domain-containing protein [Defluviitaleaceae bacterium]